jgi:thiazolinyl imide reductase
MELLDRGIHVLAEHPLGVVEMQEALNLARENGCAFQVNAHFGDLDAPQAFFRAMTRQQQHGPVLHYSLILNPRTLYSGLDLLGRAHGSLAGARVEPGLPGGKNESFRPLNIQLGGTDVSLLCQNFVSEQDDGTDSLISHHLVAIFRQGNLQLCESYGPVLWFPIHTSATPESWKICVPEALAMPTGSELGEQRDLANLVAVQEMTRVVGGVPAPPHQRPEYLVALASLWEACSDALFS